MSNHTVNLKARALSACPEFLRGYWDRIESSPLGLRLAKGAFWSLAGALISRGLALLASIIVARILGKEGFGELGIIQSTVGMFGVFAGFGLGMTATKYVAEFRTKNPERAGRVIALSNIVAIVSGGVMSLILVFLAPWLARSTLAAPHLTLFLQIAAGLLFLSALNGAQIGTLAGFEAFRTIAKVNFWAGIADRKSVV
jgi:O-antigen/teichoic acid export membrane protein